MDFFAHIAWVYILFNKLRKKKQLKWALLLAGLPDLLSWGIFTFHALTNGMFGRPDITVIPEDAFVWTLYNLTHSIFVCGLVLFVVWLILKKIPLFLLAYPLHIIIDIPTHSRYFLPTPFLWPVSSWNFPGFSWGQAWFMLLNWGSIFVLIIYINRIKIKKAFKRII